MSAIEIAATGFGAIFGFAVGGPAGALKGAQIGYGIGRTIDQVTTNNPQGAQFPTLDDSRVQSSEYGIPIPQIFGTFRVAGNVIWVKEIVGSFDGQNATYDATFAVGICKGPIDSVRRVWADGTLIYDIDADNDGVVKIDWQWRLYYGTETQLPDPVIEAEFEPGQVPAFRGLAYARFYSFPLHDFGNRIPRFTFEVVNDKSDVVPYSSLGSEFPADSFGSDSWANLPDGVHVILEGASDMLYKIDAVTGAVVAATEITGSNGVNTWTNAATNIDTDEDGYIYMAIQWPELQFGPTVIQSLAKFSPDTLAAILVGQPEDSGGILDIASYESYLYYVQLAVVKQRPGLTQAPLIYLIDSQDWAVHLRLRTNLTWNTSGATKLEFASPAGTQATNLSIDHSTGRCYVAFDGSSTHYIGRIVPTYNGTGDNISLPDGGYLETWDVTSYVGGDWDGAARIYYDDTTQQLFYFSYSYDSQSQATEQAIHVFDMSDESSSGLTYLGTVSGTIDFPGWIQSYLRQGAVNGYLYYIGGYPQGIVYQLDIYSREVTQSWDAGIIFLGGGIYHESTHSVLQSANLGVPGEEYFKVLLDRINESGAALSAIVSDICGQANLEAGDIDVSELTDIVPGYYIGNRSPARVALEVLATAYFFDAIESDGKLYFLKRGRAVTVTIPEGQLAAHKADAERPQELTSTRADELSLPRQVDVIYAAQSASYDDAVQQARRILGDAQHYATLRFPLSLTDGTAAAIAMNHLVLGWLQRTRHQFHVPRAYSYLNPSDVVIVQEGGVDHRVRIEGLTYNGGVLDIGAVDDDPAAYNATSDLVYGGTDAPDHDDEVPFVGITNFVIADVPLLYGANNEAGVYIIASAQNPDEWRGAMLHKSTDGGSTWVQYKALTIDGIVGEAATALSDVTDPFVWDHGNTVRVVLANADDVLESSTEADVLNGANLAVLGDEVIQFVTATEVAEGVYDLSGLLRARRGSDYATGSHSVGEKFAILTSDTIHFAPFPIEDADIYGDRVPKTTNFRAVTYGQEFDNGYNVTKAVEVNNIQPLSPVHVKAVENSDGGVTISWIRRTRLNGEWRNNVDVPLGETTEEYTLAFWALRGVTAFKRIFLGTDTSNTTSYSLTAAEMADLGLQSGDYFRVYVYQMSSVVGAGHHSEEILVKQIA